MKSDPAPALRRVIGLSHATAMVVGTIIGASIFVQPSEITGRVPSVAGIFGVWIVAGVLTLFGALVCAELASLLPESGGVYVFLRESFAPSLGFLWGWAMFWTMHSGIIAAIAVVFARYVGYFVPLTGPGATGVAVGVIAVLSAVNYVGVRHGSTLQTLFTWGKLIAIVAMITIGFAYGPAESPEETSVASLSSARPADFALAVAAGLFAFGGWHMVTYSAGETIRPRRTIPRALVAGVGIVTLCYIGLNAVYLHVLPLEAVASSERVAADAADALFGFGGGATMAAVVLFSTFGALSGIVLAGPRVYHAMARDGLVFAWMGQVHPRFRTPHRAIVAQAVWSAVLVGTGTYRALFTRVVYTEWIFFGLLALGLLRLRRRARVRDEHAIRIPAWVPLLFAIAALGIVANQVASDPVESLLGLSLVLIGLPVYHGWVRRRSRRERA